MAGIDIISDSTGKEIVAAIKSTDVAQARILEINTAAESKKNEVLESIPEDYSNLLKEVDGINNSLNSEISRAKEADETLKSRVDNIISLPEGSTTGDAELQDIRVKADGTIAENASNAVREQISELKSDFGNLRFSITENNLLHIERKE